MYVKQPHPWLSVVATNVYYLVYLGFVFKQAEGYLTILCMAALNATSSFIKHLQLMEIKKLDISSPGLINQSVFLIWFEDIALVELCEIIIPTIFSIVMASAYYIFPNK